MSMLRQVVRGAVHKDLDFGIARTTRVCLCTVKAVQRQGTRRSFSASTSNRQAVSLDPPSGRLGHDVPFDRTGGSPKAYKTTSQPDYLLSPSARFIDESPSSLSLVFLEGSLQIHDEAENRYTKIPAQWLRDNCSCSQCRNTDTAQRQINVLEGNINFDVSDAKINGEKQKVVTVKFVDGHQSQYHVDYLLNRRGPRMTKSRFGLAPITTWKADISSSPPMVDYSAVSEKAGMSSLLHKIRALGFCIVDGMPATPEATEALLDTIGPIRNTHYGGFYDFTADLTMKDTAYTSEYLEPHTDNTYFTEPAGIQALHMLSHTEGTGGESSLVDGFGAAVQLFVEDRDAYTTLSTTGVYAHASGNEGISIQPSSAFPVLNHDLEAGHLTAVRWNNADRAGIAADFAGIEKWYEAAAKFNKLLNAPENVYWFKLKPGQTLLFDNWRVLHGRNSFTGKRRMCGGYINRDDFISKYRMTSMSAEDISFSTVSG
ncbi:hypothetical protein AC579_9332 [Pseudocercospora musae]|uniref:Trimethyllysine dioxygenase n=1 Tax=Pseudocercospora musae TaxID=113226 RepID=A0A139HZM6_9PEZI|nr:hypothetical protein AC579_9332 [Pseudocercospora musae]